MVVFLYKKEKYNLYKQTLYIMYYVRNNNVLSIHNRHGDQST